MLSTLFKCNTKSQFIKKEDEEKVDVRRKNIIIYLVDTKLRIYCSIFLKPGGRSCSLAERSELQTPTGLDNFNFPYPNRIIGRHLIKNLVSNLPEENEAAIERRQCASAQPIYE